MKPTRYVLDAVCARVHTCRRLIDLSLSNRMIAGTVAAIRRLYRCVEVICFTILIYQSRGMYINLNVHAVHQACK